MSRRKGRRDYLNEQSTTTWLRLSSRRKFGGFWIEMRLIASNVKGI